jgi:hypothetical protein
MKARLHSIRKYLQAAYPKQAISISFLNQKQLAFQQDNSHGNCDSIILLVQPTLMLLTDRGVFLERTRAECKNKLYLYCRHEFVMFRF